MLPPYYFYWFRIDNKHMTEPWLDQALMKSAAYNLFWFLDVEIIDLMVNQSYSFQRKRILLERNCEPFNSTQFGAIPRNGNPIENTF